MIRAHHLIFFADRINVNAGWLALKKSPFVCCFTSYTPDSLTRFPFSKDTFAKRPQFWCMLAKERIWPRKPAELGKRTRSRNFCTLSNLFKTLYDSHLPSISAFQLHGTIALCQFYLSFTFLCWTEVLYCSKIFFLFLNEHRVGCSWCQPYRRYFFCIYMCISLFMKDIFGRTWHQPRCLYFFWFLQVWAADASAKLPFTWLASWISIEVLLRSLHLYLYLHLYLQILWHSHNADLAKGPSWDILDH